jgi:Uma2 family endonuclease
MVAEPHRLVMSVEEYLTLDRNSLDVRHEFIDGHVYMLAGGTANHSTININMIRELSLALRGNPCRVYNSDMRVRLSEKRYVYPDVSVSCDARDRGTVDILQYPSLIVEVLSPSTAAFDRGKKFSYYRACSTVQEYVLVETQWQAIEVFRHATENLWTYHFFGAGDQVELASLGVSFPVATLYENVELPEDTPDSSSM